MSSTYSKLGASYVRLKDLERRADKTKADLNARARRAYKDKGWTKLRFLFNVETFSQFMTRWRILGESFERDANAYDALVSAQEDVTAERNGVDVEKKGLLETSSRLQAIKNEVVKAMKSEQALLSAARTELSRLESARRRDSGRFVSPAVAARRAARQIVLDQRLEALLAWYAPGTGPASYVPDVMRGSGIKTSGLSSWYGPGFDRRRASSGATYKQEQLTAASLVLPFGTLLKVTYNGRAAVVVITDRGPYVEGRVLDLSMGAANALGLRGVKTVEMEIMVPKTPAPPFP